MAPFNIYGYLTLHFRWRIWETNFDEEIAAATVASSNSGDTADTPAAAAAVLSPSAKVRHSFPPPVRSGADGAAVFVQLPALVAEVLSLWAPLHRSTAALSGECRR
jgi:hypothetical protein